MMICSIAEAQRRREPTFAPLRLCVQFLFHVFLSFFLLLGCGNIHASSYSNPGLYLVDEGQNTYLFRGKMPASGGCFAYEDLSKHFQEYLEAKGKQLSPDFDLLCVSLLNCSEAKERKIEIQWFAQHPDRGRLWMYPLFGSLVDPRGVSQSFRRSVLACDPDGIQSLVSQLKWQVDAGHPAGRDVVIYVHCHAGKDRTGEACASYLMQYKGYSYQDAMALGKKIAGRKLKRVSINAIRWHAYYLRDVLNYPTVGPID